LPHHPCLFGLSESKIIHPHPSQSKIFFWRTPPPPQHIQNRRLRSGCEIFGDRFRYVPTTPFVVHLTPQTLPVQSTKAHLATPPGPHSTFRTPCWLIDYGIISQRMARMSTSSRFKSRKRIATQTKVRHLQLQAHKKANQCPSRSCHTDVSFLSFSFKRV
jgi:hypothetical protein